MSRAASKRLREWVRDALGSGFFGGFGVIMVRLYGLILIILG